MNKKLSGSRPSSTKEVLVFADALLLTVPEPIFQGSLVVQAGRILDLGPAARIRRRWQGKARFFDATGLTIHPGLTNGHCHASMSFFRDHAHGQSEMIERYFFPAEGKLDESLVEDLAYGTLVPALRSGTTCVFDHYYFSAGVGRALEQLGMKGVIGETVADLGGAFPSRTSWDRARKLIEQWPFSARIRPTLAPHASDTVSGDLLTEIANYGRQNHLPFHYHLAQTRSERERTQKIHGLSPVAVMEAAGLLGPRSLAVHLIDATPEEFKRLREHDVVIALCPSSQVLYERLAPLSEIFKNEFRTVLGSDTAASNDGADMISEAKIAALFSVDRGSADSAELALRFFLSLTSTPQEWSNGLGAKRIAIGEPADLVFLQHGFETHPISRPYVNFIYSTTSAQVMHVMVDGKWVLWERKLVNVSESALQERFERAVRQIQARAKLPKSRRRLVSN